MKTIVKKLVIWQINALFLMISLSSCNKDDLTNARPLSNQNKQTFSNDALPSIAKEQIDLSIQNWNRYFSKEVEAVNYNFSGVIHSLDEIERIKHEITSLDAWIPSGPLDKPEEMTAMKFREYKENTKVIERVRNLLDTTLAIGQQIVYLNWKKGNTQFSSICIVGEQGIVYDNMLVNVAIMEVPEEEPEYVDYSNTNSKISLTGYGWTWTVYHAKWIWGSTRGKGKVTVYAYCNGNSISASHNTYNSSAYFELGSCLLKVKNTQNSPCHKVQHTWGWSTVVGSVSFDSNNFKVNVSGIGSKATGGGNMGACCGYYI